MPIGGSRGYPTENQPLSYAQQYQAANPYPPAAAPPSSVYAPPAAPALNPNTPSATIGGGSVYAGNLAAAQTGFQNVTGGYQSPSPTPGQATGANVIGGLQPFDRGGAGMFQGLGGDPASALANLGNNYAGAYNAYANNVQNQTNAIQGGYQQTAQNQYNAQQGVANGYNQLSQNVLGGISNIGSDQRALLNRNYAQQAGSADQNLINSGLGNSTVRANVQRGIGLDQGLAQNNLANSIAQTKAGYQSSIGQAGLGYQGQAIRDNTGLAENQLNWMNSITNLPPDAGAYNSLAQQAGAAIQSNANRAQIDRLASQNSDIGAQVRQAAVLGGSGGLSPGTGGSLPRSPYNSGQGSVGQTPGAGGGLDFGSSFIQSGVAANPPRQGVPASGASAAAGGFGSGLPAGQNLMPAGSQAAAQAAAGWGAGSVYGQPVDQGGGWSDVGAALGGDQGGGWGDVGAALGGGWGDVGAALGYDQVGPQYDYSNGIYDIGSGAAFGTGGFFDDAGQTAFPSYDYTAGAQDFGAGAFGGAYDAWDW